MSLTDEQLDARVASQHRNHEDGRCACVDGYVSMACQVADATDALLAEVRALRAERDRLRDSLSDVVGHAGWHHLSFQSHTHDCHEEFHLLRDEARNLLGEDV